MGQRAMGMSGDPQQDFMRRRLLAVLGANMMGSPHPGAIGQGMQNGVLASIDAGQEYQERVRQQRQDSWREEDANWQRSERERASRERGEQDAAMRAEGERIAQQRARLRSEGDVNADFYSAKQVEEQYGKRFGYQEPAKPERRVLGGDLYEIGEDGSSKVLIDTPDKPSAGDAINWQTVERNGQTFQVHPRTGEVRPVAGLPAEEGDAEESLASREAIAHRNAKATYDEAVAKWEATREGRRPIWANHYNREAQRLGLPMLPGATYRFGGPPGGAKAAPRAGVRGSAMGGGVYEYDSNGNLVRRD